MHLFSLFRQTTDEYGSFNQSAITSTGATVPLYFHKHHFSYTKKKNRPGSKKIYQAHESKRHYALRSMESAQELGFASADRQAMLSFDQITKSKRRKIFLHRLFFTFICVLVLLVIIVLTMILIIQFSWIFCNSTLFLFLVKQINVCKIKEEKCQQKPKVVKRQRFPSPKISVHLAPRFSFFFKIRDICRSIRQEGLEHHRRINNHLGILLHCIHWYKYGDTLHRRSWRVCIFERGLLWIKSGHKPKGSRSRGIACWLDQSKQGSWNKTVKRISDFTYRKDENEMMEICFWSTRWLRLYIVVLSTKETKKDCRSFLSLPTFQMWP